MTNRGSSVNSLWKEHGERCSFCLEKRNIPENDNVNQSQQIYSDNKKVNCYCDIFIIGHF